MSRGRIVSLCANLLRSLILVTWSFALFVLFHAKLVSASATDEEAYDRVAIKIFGRCFVDSARMTFQEENAIPYIRGICPLLLQYFIFYTTVEFHVRFERVSLALRMRRVTLLTARLRPRQPHFQEFFALAQSPDRVGGIKRRSRCTEPAITAIFRIVPGQRGRHVRKIIVCDSR